MLHGCGGNEKLILKSPLLPFHLPTVLSFILFLWVYSSFFLHRFYVDLFSGSSNLRGMSYELSSADVDSSSKLVSLAGTSLQSRNSLGQVLSWIQTAGRQRASFKWLCQLDQWAKTMTTKTSVQIVRHQVFQELYGVLVDLNCFFCVFSWKSQPLFWQYWCMPASICMDHEIQLKVVLSGKLLGSVMTSYV